MQRFRHYRELAVTALLFGLGVPVVFTICALISLAFVCWWEARDRYKDWKYALPADSADCSSESLTGGNA